MAPESRFLALPREIRDAIYEHYVDVPGGYVCDTEKFVTRSLELRNQGVDSQSSTAGALRRADGRPTDFNLMYACKLTAQEMSGIALRRNTITFSTATSDEIRVLAARFDGLMSYGVGASYQGILHFAGHTIAEKDQADLKRKYPQFSPLLDLLKKKGDMSGDENLSQRNQVFKSGPYGEVPSTYRAFCRDALRAISLCQAGRECLDRHTPFSGHSRYGNPDPLRAIQRPIDHWIIPSQDDIKSLMSCYSGGSNDVDRVVRCRDRTKYRFSAAAVAIQFLKDFPPSSRIHVGERCRESWRGLPWALDSRQISRNIANWMAEASALVPAGMPPNSFTLVLDGQPVPEYCARIFQQVVQRDAAWQAAWIESQDRGILPSLPWLAQRHHELDPWYVEKHCRSIQGYVFHNFPQALEDMTNNRSIVRCNFDVGETWNVERLIREHEQWTQKEWIRGWNTHDPDIWYPEAPLPGLQAIFEENNLPLPDDYESSVDSDDPVSGDEDEDEDDDNDNGDDDVV
ncbi:hypothetical protein CkaCkLH20_07198 [Colletotrichum karsti]|uniref:Uncharacterized protein n=1 Tax=Colletotrichum karsti TaxID=1095194 RepID=A0A9P6I149_9PEZI|nr:uncharacterized protein CkaCkLH20_07198 [Colletotrichum karsti]KAF9875378.1 hypothetical protein CkaCkLH20_07198 [Colletotrichum karsti]